MHSSGTRSSWLFWSEKMVPTLYMNFLLARKSLSKLGSALYKTMECSITATFVASFPVSCHSNAMSTSSPDLLSETQVSKCGKVVCLFRWGNWRAVKKFMFSVFTVDVVSAASLRCRASKWCRRLSL